MLLSLIAFTLAKLPGEIDPEVLKTHVRFLASDELEGRGTPSEGLNKAAKYIASEFRKAKLTSLVDDYYQPATIGTDNTKVQNVVAVLPGNDPKLKNTYVIVSAHYDHLGIRQGRGDGIFNGANDNASGVAGVIEIAKSLKAFGSLKRSILFVLFYGEERGLVGSRYYTKNPLVPLKDTSAVINIEQIGRTDDSEGPRVAEFNLTGHEYSNLFDYLKKGAEEVGIKVTGHPKLSAPYFAASDNWPFAQAGVPAHTISSAYSFPDYHGPDDEYEKLDYNNMAKLVRAIANGVRYVADTDKNIEWADIDRTKSFREAQKKLQENTTDGLK
jgi:Zn-dependent M28 family amino/carboxypeptidase